MSLKKSLLILSFSLFLFSCNKKNKGNGGSEIDDFNQVGLLQNIGENIIVKNYKELVDNLNILNVKKNDFFNEPNQTTHAELKLSFINSYNSFQKVSMFEFGPAADIIFKGSMNSFPSDLSKINDALNGSDYNLDVISNIDMKGFGALDYLFNGVSDDTEGIIDFYSTNQNATNHKAFVSLVIDDMLANSNNVYGKWESSYLNDFVSNSGTESGTSISLLINNLNMEYETFIRTVKIGIPSGIVAISTDKDLKFYCEGYYSEISLDLINSNLNNIIDVYNGAAGIGFDDYVESLDNSSLNNTISNQFIAAKDAIDAIPSLLSTAIVSSPDEVATAYLELQKNVVNLKVELTNVLGVDIEYQDNDND